MAWFFIAGGKLITVVYGPAWAGSVPSLKILTVSGALGSIYTLCDTLTSAKGLVYVQFRNHLIYAAMVVAGALFGIGYGIEGVAFAISFAVFVMYLLMAQLGIRAVGGTWREFLLAQIPGMITALIVACVSAVVLIFCNVYLFADMVASLLLTLSFAAVYPIIFIFCPLRYLGEIPEFLLIRCSSLLPYRCLNILNRRLNIIMKTDIPAGSAEVLCNINIRAHEDSMKNPRI